MDPLLTLLLTGVIACLVGIAIGWRISLRRFRRYLVDMEHETGARSLELLETRQHLRKISGHLKTNLKKDKTIRQLRRKQKSLLRDIDQQVLQARRLEKAHFIQTAKIKLELIEARMSKGQTGDYDENGLFTPTNPDAVENGTAISQHGLINGSTKNAKGDNILTNPFAADPSVNPSTTKDFGQLNSELQLLLEQAGIRRVRQLANLSKQEIDQLTSHSDRQTAE